MAVKAFDFTKDKFDETHEVYYEILKQLGIKDPKKHIEKVMSFYEHRRQFYYIHNFGYKSGLL